MLLRKGTLNDVNKFLKMMATLPMPKNETISYKGFLMGSSKSNYEHFVNNDITWVVENKLKEVVAYSIVLRNGTFKKQELWKKLMKVKWKNSKLESIEDSSICFFEQLATLPSQRNRIYGKNVGIIALVDAFQSHDYAITTVVTNPVRNMASRSFVQASGFQHIGEIIEDYPKKENVRSDVFIISKENFIQQMKKPYKKLFEKTLSLCSNNLNNEIIIKNINSYFF